MANGLGGVKTPPYSTSGKGGCRGRCLHRPASRCPPERADDKHRPLQNEGRGLLAPEGSIGEESKSVKKNAALLHFLAFSLADHPFGVPRGERLAAHNERRQFAAQTRSCGYSPRWGEHCSLPSFAALNRGPLLATPPKGLLAPWNPKVVVERAKS